MESDSFIAFLRMEADLSEEKAKRLRAQADALAQQHGITVEMESSYELNPEELAPLDEFGVPKYKGRKRGRKPKKRKRQLNPNRQKRQHTAYTLFVQENYPGVRAQYPSLQSKDIIGMVARQWATVPETEKTVWKERAIETHEATPLVEGADDQPEEHVIELGEGDVEEEEGDEEGDEEDDDQADDSEEEEAPKRRRGRPRKKP
mmetsp:Transcript_31570/g.52118  ORF Transcript_31570/g.52118 Transcript_31570/m.52118 type:complete len:204 (+) Transcript_31570:73-684(+)|eukprot:CAMPEP_0119003094 /NCGR_PEP_ID=MMETSP1176-20130426/352_1 /TAXON_ID=265551 /ORGANISM="Synedropsis recta cf, Strain CCMP1620" /LENGTH=203 /DNA_ID=CAMNT_0006954659 /DNA_START=33 /DNA_END=644 /DNA_ORIENTATION=+